jgi:hypothetical protein
MRYDSPTISAKSSFSFSVMWRGLRAAFARCAFAHQAASMTCRSIAGKAQYAVSRRMLGPEIEGEVAQVSFGHNGLASAAGSTLAAAAGSRSIGFQFHRADVIDAARTGRASGTSMLLSLLESRKYVTE